MIKKIYVLLFMFFLVIPLLTFAKKNHPADPLVVKVVVVYEDPILPIYGNKRLHECFRTPAVKTRIWNDPEVLSADYKKHWRKYPEM